MTFLNRFERFERFALIAFITFITFGAILALAMTFSPSALGVTTSMWKQNSQKDFDKGKANRVSVSSEGEVKLSLSLSPIQNPPDFQELYIWCLAEDSKGNIYAGTGNGGKVYKLTPEGNLSLFFDSPEIGILSLAVDAQDNLYAGSSPDGIVYKLSPDGLTQTSINLNEKYVWDLTFDDKYENLYAATGSNGRIYKLSPDGNKSLFYDSNEPHIMCLAYQNGSLYAGSEGNGLIYKLSPEGKAMVLYDSQDKEIKKLLIDSVGNLYASSATGELQVVAEGQPQQQPPRTMPPGPPQQQMGPPSRQEVKSRIYRISPEGVVSTVWSAQSAAMILSLLVDSDQNLLVGTNDEGQIYSVNPANKKFISLTQCQDSQVLSILKSKSKTIYVSSGNGAKIYKLSNNYEAEGSLESDVFDTTISSKWGNIYWRNQTAPNTQIVFFSRSGNTEKPDNTWSEWSNEYTSSEGAPISSPPARFIQWKTKLITKDPSVSPVLKYIGIAYLQRNVQPEVSEVNLDSQDGSEAAGAQSGPPRLPSQRPSPEDSQTADSKKTLRWQAKDPNNDALQYSIYYRGLNESNWKLLKDELKTNRYTWDSALLPDGIYLIKVMASDKLSNPSDLALSGEDISEPFTIDNTAPTIVELKANPIADAKFEVGAIAEDKTSYISEAQYSVDAGEWQLVFPTDQIFDQNREHFSFTTKTLEKGEHSIVLRVSDGEKNATSAKIVVVKE